MTNPPSDQGIPLLTEVIGPSSSPESEAAAAPAGIPSSAANGRPPAQAVTTPAAPMPPAPAAVATASGVPAASAVSSFPAASPAAPAGQASPRADVSNEAPATGAWNDSELRDLENELRLRITRQVLGRIDFVLDHRVRNTVTEIVDAAIDALAGEIKRGLHETMTDIVARAVAQEISRLQSGKK